MKNIAKQAKNAFLITMNLSNDIKNKALQNIIDILKDSKDEILKANEIDLKEAKELNISQSNYSCLKIK